MKKPIIAVTMGDPASIGSEISIKAFQNGTLFETCKPLIVGDAGIMEFVVGRLGFDGVKIHPIGKVADAVFQPGAIDVLDLNIAKAGDFEFGKVSALAGDASFRYVEKAISLALAKEVDATVTNAINKEAVRLAGHDFSGHTEIYAQLTGTQKYSMLLVHENLRVVHVSTHVSLREACDRVKKERVLDVIHIAHKACKDIGVAEPRIGVAGLNPHSGENGLFGREEIDEIIPAIDAAKAQGIVVDGPVPPDTVFSKAKGGWYDIVVAMYHDQGHIPLKLAGFIYNPKTQKWDAIAGVNITLGLPIIRTSVDHGTAFDQALKGTANETSLLNAIDYAVKLALNH